MRRFCLLTFVTSLAHSLNIRAEPKSALNDGFAPEGVRIYENLKQDVELGIHHPSSIQAAAGVMVASKRAALAYLSSHSSTGMTGMTGGTGGFDYPSFSKDIDTQSEKTLVRLFDTTESALEATRSDVLGRHGLGSATGAATGATGSEATDSSSTGSAMTGNEELKSTTDATGATAGAAGATGAAEEESTGAGAATQETGGTGSGSTKGGKHGNTKEQEQNEYSNAALTERKDMKGSGHYKWLEGAGAGETDVRHQMLKGNK